MRTIVRGACPLDCPDTCSWLVEVEDGRAVGLRGDRSHPFTHGALCPKVNRYLDAVNGPGRVTQPLRRVGAEGRGRRSRRSAGTRRWTRPPRACARRSSGTAPSRSCRTTSPAPRAWSRAGSWARACSPRWAPRGCRRRSAPPPPTPRCDATYGGSVGTDAEDFEHARLIAVGRQPALDEPPPVALRAGGAEGAARTSSRSTRCAPTPPSAATSTSRPARAPTPRSRSASCASCSTRAPRIATGSSATPTAGPSSRRASPSGRSSAPPEICGLPVERVVALGRRFAHTRPTAIRLGLGLQRHGGAGAAMRAILALPALTGDFRHVGGGVLCMTGGHFGGIEAEARRDPGRPGRAAGAHDQHVAPRRGAARGRRPAGRGARRLRREPRGEQSRPSRACRPASRARICSRSCSSSG